jgi:GGDEF domain-containing protein
MAIDGVLLAVAALLGADCRRARRRAEALERRHQGDVETAPAEVPAGPDPLPTAEGAPAPLQTLSGLHAGAAAAERRAALHGRPFAVVMVELAELPLVNARDGYETGDQLIRDAAQVASAVASERGGIAGRYSGARLALLVPETEEAQAGALSGDLGARLPKAAGARIVHAVRRPAETGAQVMERARAALRPATVPADARAGLHLSR